MQVTSLDLRKNSKAKAKHQRRLPMHPRDSCQDKINRLESSFTIKSHMVVPHLKPKPKHQLPTKQRCATSYQSSPPKPQYGHNGSQVAVGSKSVFDQPKQDNIQVKPLGRGVSFSLKLSENTKKGAMTSKRNNLFQWHNENMVSSYIITDRLTLDMQKLKQKRKSVDRNQNKSELLFMSQQRSQHELSPATQHLLYFERERLMSYQHSKSPELKRLVENQYHEEIDKAVRESQRSVMIESIKEEVNRKKSITRLKVLLETAKSKSISRVLAKRKSQLKQSLLQRKFNPYYTYLSMSQQQKQHFKNQHSPQHNDLDNVNVSIHINRV